NPQIDEDDPKHNSQAPSPSPSPSPPPSPSPSPPPSPQDLPSQRGSGLHAVDVAPPTAITSTKRGIGEKIVELKGLDNTRTLSNTIEYVSGLKSGAILSEQLLEDARLRLHSTGLFKDVSITWEEPSPRHAGQGIRVVIRAIDKFPWVIAPIFSYQARN